MFQRLRKRKLVQWGMAYLAGAFVVFQLLDALETPLQLSTTIQQAILALLGIGFFITLVLAWYHGEKGRQRVSGPELLMVASLLLVAGVAVSLLPGTGGESQPDQVAAFALPDDERPSVAVLPCENISPNPDDGYLADGIHEEILVRLQKISGLRSIGRTSVLQYREGRPSVQEIAHALGVGFVGECSVRKDPDQEQIRLTFQLLDAAGTQIAADPYDRDLTSENLFAIEGNVASQVASSVQAEILPSERARIERVHTGNVDAYEAFLLGRHYLDVGDPESLREALRYFELSVEEDSNFALGYAGLAEAYDYLASSGGLPPAEGWLSVERAARTALRIDSTLAEAWTMLGDARMIGWDWRGAEDAFQRAIELRPGYGTAHQFYSILLIAQGRVDEALAEARTGVAVSPADPSTYNGYAIRLLVSRRYSEALARFRDSRRLSPAGLIPLWWQILAYCYADMPDRALETVQEMEATTSDSIWVWGAHAFVNAFAGEGATARRYLRQLENLSSTRYVDLDFLWVPYAALGDRDRAFALLGRAVEEKSWGTIYVGIAPFADPLRNDPRYGDLLERIGIGHLEARFDSLAVGQPRGPS